MKTASHELKKTLDDFFGIIISVVSEDTSDSYALMVMEKFNKKNEKDFPFLRYVRTRRGKIEIRDKINGVSPKFVAKYVKKLMDGPFSDLFRHLVRKKLSVGLYEDLKRLGVDF